MSLRERMLGASWNARQLRMYRRYGVLDNPFPFAGQPTRAARLEDAVDDAVVDRFRRFEEGGHASQVVTIAGTQGAGKASLLDYYEGQFRDYFRGRISYFVIRHQPDSVDSALTTILRTLGQRHLESIGRDLARSSDAESTAAKEPARYHDIGIVLDRLERAGASEDRLVECARLAWEWLQGAPASKRYREALGVGFPLDTVESRTQALRDVISVSLRLRLLKGIVLLIDELEKQDYSLSKTPVLRFLLSIRELIDALPKRLFLMLAMTPTARRRYFAMIPAMAGRLQDIITLPPLAEPPEAERLFEFYLQRGRETAGSNPRVQGETQGTSMPFGAGELTDMFYKLRDRSEQRGTEGVTPREYLHRLHQEWEQRAPAG